MPIESAPFVNSLVATNPPNSDPVQQGADHLRLVKAALLASFPNINAAVTATPTQINGWDGRIGTLETNRARKDVSDTFAARMTFTVGADAASFQRGNAELEPVGVVHMWLEAGAPTGYLLLDGSAVSRTTYATLFALWGTRYGAGNGTTTFNLPDLRLRFPVMAGTGLTLNTTGGSQTPAVTVAAGGDHNHGGATGAGGDHNHGGGTAGHALTWSQLAPHYHNGSTDVQGAHNHGQAFVNNIFPGGGGISGGGAVTYTTAGINTDGAHAHNLTTDWQGLGEAHSHALGASGSHTHSISASGTHTHTASIADGRPPYFVVNFIVRAL